MALATLVVVDPVSTGALLCQVAFERGFQVVALWSRESSATVRRLFCSPLACKEVEEEDEKQVSYDMIELHDIISNINHNIMII